MDLLQKWTKTCETVDDEQQFIRKEQFLETLSNPKQKLWVMERNTLLCITVGKIYLERSDTRLSRKNVLRLNSQSGISSVFVRTKIHHPN